VLETGWIRRRNMARTPACEGRGGGGWTAGAGLTTLDHPPRGVARRVRRTLPTRPVGTLSLQYHVWS